MSHINKMVNSQMKKRNYVGKFNKTKKVILKENTVMEQKNT